MKVEKKTKIIREMARRVIEEGGEGLMLRRSQSLYVPGRSPSLLLKFKVIIHIIIFFIFMYMRG